MELSLTMPVSTESPVVQAYTWGLFIMVAFVAWDFTIGSALRVMKDDFQRGEDAAQMRVDNGGSGTGAYVMRKTYLVSLVAYAQVVMWFHVLFFVTIIFVAAAIANVMAPFAPNDMIERGITFLANPSFLFHSMTTAHLPLHAALVLLSMAAGSAALLFYVRPVDQLSYETLTAKFKRVAYTLPMLSIIVYGCHALRCIIDKM